MPSRKRAFDVSEALHSDESKLQKIRNMWQFANLCQWIYIFGKTVKIDESIDIEARFAPLNIAYVLALTWL